LIYQMKIKHKPELFIVYVECPEEMILSRLKKRVENFSISELNETPSLAAYKSSKKVFQNPEKDTLPEECIRPVLISYSSHTKNINIGGSVQSSNLTKIINALK